MAIKEFSYLHTNANLHDAAEHFFKYFLNIHPQPSTRRPQTIRRLLQTVGSDVPNNIASLEKNNTFKQLLDSTNVHIIGKLTDKTFADRAADEQEWDSIVKELEQSHYNRLLIFALDLPKIPKFRKSDIVAITRAFNRAMRNPDTGECYPVILLLRYDERKKFALASCERSLYAATKHQIARGEKLGKVVFVNEIKTLDTHRGHFNILKDLQIPTTIKTFDALYKHWLEVFNTRPLNDKFYKELETWYDNAKLLIRFPQIPDKNGKSHDVNEDKNRSMNVIRMLTRLIFIWFIKEKELVPENLFDKKKLKEILLDFQPNSAEQGSYYNAILQNLFFATLNTERNGESESEQNSRYFAQVGGDSPDYLNTFAYRYAELFSLAAPTAILDLFADIPFLNGGLFECLDHKEDEKEYRYDGFSSIPEKRAFVPNVVFFGTKEEDIDLGADMFGEPIKAVEKKKKTPKTNLSENPLEYGLIGIFNRYKFTIEENTPLEEEIALDPELLGKIFESLLGTFNPETQQTARKATGSFYTPREIVQYMVDESLKEYLLGQRILKEKMPNEDGTVNPLNFKVWSKGGEYAAREELNLLFAPNAEDIPFSDHLKEILIEAISNCKILDPACGSGAFPMGILQRMVFILQRLDPNNIRWKKQLIKKAEQDRDKAEEMSDDVIRQQSIDAANARIRYIEESFETQKHELDFLRKLGLIETCIYGVDIQQIAVQIAKLRFFISLVVEQEIQPLKPNKGILPMPNLETKFVAANTLVGLKSQSTLSIVEESNPLVDKLEKDLQTKYHRIFYARKYKEKKELKESIRKIRLQLHDIYSAAIDAQEAELKANWNPFDQVGSSPFFDAKLMFGMDKGFDVVIGNPPYGADLDTDLQYALDEKFIKQKSKTKNTAIYFIYWADLFLNSTGINSFIIPKSICYSQGWNKCAEFVLNGLVSLIDTGKSFENVLLEAVIFIKNKNNKNAFYSSGLYENGIIQMFAKIPKSMFTKYKVLLAGQTNQEINTIFSITQKFNSVYSDFVKIERGLNWQSKAQKHQGNTPIFRGAHLNQFFLEDALEYIDLSKFSIKEYEYLLKPKVLNQLAIAHVKNPYPHFYLQSTFDDTNKLVFETISCTFVKAPNINLKFITALNNSKLFAWILYKFIYANAIRSTRFDEQYVGRIPCPNINNLDTKVFSVLCDYMLYLRNPSTAPISEYVTNAHIGDKVEELIDAAVYELYFPESIAKAGAEVLAHIAEQMPALEAGREAEILNEVYDILIESRGRIRNNILKQKLEVEEVMIINGSALLKK